VTSIASYRDSHEAWRAEVLEASWLQTIRRRSLQRFEREGFPGRKVEAWKYTNLKNIADVPFVHEAERSPAPDLESVIAPHRVEHAAAELVFVNGHFAASFSRRGELPRGVTVEPLSEAITSHGALLEALIGVVASQSGRPFTSLNSAFLQDGALIHFGRRARCEAPIHLIFLAVGGEQPLVAHPRNLIVGEATSEGSVVRTHLAVGDNVTLTNVVTEILLRRGARLTHQVTADGATASQLMNTTEARLSRDAYLHDHVSWLRGGWVRHNLEVRLAEAGASCDLDGLYVLGERQHVDNHTVIDHVMPHCVSREFYKGVLGGRAKGIFSGRVIVREHAQKTDSSQNNRNLLLTDTADASAKPQLEIYADDVKCAHGTTVGQLDMQQLWYLKTRGIPDMEARKMLTSAFVQDRVDTLRDEVLRERLGRMVDVRLAEVQEDEP
jgi:Fe-S cluster assembly protein SufD